MSRYWLSLTLGRVDRVGGGARRNQNQKIPFLDVLDHLEVKTTHHLFSQADDGTMMNVLSNFGDGRPAFGPEILMKNYVELSEDLKGLTELRTKPTTYYNHYI